MPKYMVIYHTHWEWPLSGTEDQIKTEFFEDATKARDYMGYVQDWFNRELKDVQMYEYTGIQYVLVERRHNDA